ncbi:MAG: hypothetical protein ACYC7L_10980 [Nitrospirota bacterium]
MIDRIVTILLSVALLAGAALLAPLPAQAGSCCGGGGGASLVLPSFYQSMIDVSVDFEKYRGFWNQDGRYTPDPPGSDLRQYRMNVGYARRLDQRWQASIMIPYIWNSNTYANRTSRTDGPGDTTMNLWYEALEDKSAWKIREVKDLIPSIMIGPSLLVPTGISPYDDVNNSFDVTGRGFYRFDGNAIISKTINPWNASLSLSYGTYLERSVNREYGRYIEPYHKKLGNRSSASLSLSYKYIVGSAGDALTASATVSHLKEDDTQIDGVRDTKSGFSKDSVGAAIAYSSTDHDWSVRLSWSHAIRRDGWGANFPSTDVYMLGVGYGFR